jgi:murein DD-endopeptidase MepM/ murein hydrolase activator NlpD
LCSPLAGDPLADLPQIISDPYRPPPPHHDERHQGVDFSYYRRNGRTSIEGVGVQSALPGVVAAAVRDSFPFGNLVIIETLYVDLPSPLRQALGMDAGESLYVLYAHMGKPPEVKPGDGVIACQPLGVVGKTGNAGVAHLHFETRLGPPGATFASMRYYDVHATQEEKDNYELWSMSGVFRHFDPMKLLSWEYN